MIERTCQGCQRPYETHPSQKPKYCSAKCAGAAKRTGEFVSCAQCGAEVWSHRSRPKRYCSKSCARTALNHTAANPSHHRDISGERNPRYGKGMVGEANPMYGKRMEQAPRWKGGRKVRSDGYTFVAQEGETGTYYVLEHRLVMERKIGRALAPEEVVHHIDGDPSNNDPANLELFANQSEHVRVGHATRG